MTLETTGSLDPWVSALDEQFHEQAIEAEADKVAAAAAALEAEMAREAAAEAERARERRARSRSPERRRERCVCLGELGILDGLDMCARACVQGRLP